MTRVPDELRQQMEFSPAERREESRRGKHECSRHVASHIQFGLNGRGARAPVGYTPDDVERLMKKIAKISVAGSGR